jgi:hypothetical protein
MSQAPFGARRAAARIRSSASASVRTPIQCTSVVNESPARMAWMWESISPGMTVRPPRSMTRVEGPASARMSAEPDRGDFAIAHRQGLRRRRVVNDDLAVEKDGVGELGLRGRLCRPADRAAHPPQPSQPLQGAFGFDEHVLRARRRAAVHLRSACSRIFRR